jgi:hypothetical protein
MYISIVNIFNKPCQCRNTDYKVDYPLGVIVIKTLISKHDNSQTVLSNKEWCRYVMARTSNISM